MIKTYVLDTRILPDPADGLYGMETYIDALPAERMEKIMRIRHPDARKQSLGAGLLLNKVAGTLAPGAEITYGSFGKPLCAEMPFNLSHTKDAVILSIWDRKDTLLSAPRRKTGCAADSNKDAAAGCLIGCDIEQIRPYRPGVARRFFTEAEYQSLEAVQDPQEQAELFCRYWTRKESVMKLTGLGLSLPMDLYDVRGSQVAVDTAKTSAWYEKGLKRGRIQAEYRQAAAILLNQTLFFQEYRYRDCCITVCSFFDQFAPAYELLQKLPQVNFQCPKGQTRG